MAYSELIKSFEKIRWYMREFYVYGFKSRDQYDHKSARSYDNERRRIESWLGDYVEFRQDNGGKTDVRWVEFTDARGRGVRFSASEPLFVQALHYGWEDLEFARHRGNEHRFNTPLVRQDAVLLNLDVRQYGLGNNSCGPTTLPQYEFDPNEPVSWTVRIEPAKGVQ